MEKVTDPELERLAILAEECGEVVQAVGKIIRHGYDNYHPKNPDVDNREHLEREIADVIAMVSILWATNDITMPDDEQVMAAVKRKMKYMHHQPVMSASDIMSSLSD